MEIIPAILTESKDEVKEKLIELSKVDRQLLRRVQIDVISDVFAKNKTIEVGDLKGMETDFLLDIQLMVPDPESHVDKCVEIGAERVIGHVEQMEDITSFIRKVREVGLEVGLGLDIHTPVKVINDVLSDLDVVLLMSVEAGFGGQEFDEAVYAKIEQLVGLRREKNLKFNICVDGGINETNVAELAKLEVDEAAIGKGLWVGKGTGEEVEEEINRLGELVDGSTGMM